MFIILSPTRWVCLDIPPDGVHLMVVADDMFVIIALPQSFVKLCPPKVIHTCNVFMRGNRFKCSDNPSQCRDDSVCRGDHKGRASWGRDKPCPCPCYKILYPFGNLLTTFAAVGGRSITPPWWMKIGVSTAMYAFSR
jgi:hypothetical protein